jgi:hypothetical protein
LSDGPPKNCYDDTALLIREVLRNGLDSDRARRSFARINGMHGRFRIAPEDFLYVLSTFVFSPIDWLEAYGRRPMSVAERQDWFIYWNEFGRRMSVSGLFDTISEFRAFARDYEARRFVYAPANRRAHNRSRLVDVLGSARAAAGRASRRPSDLLPCARRGLGLSGAFAGLKGDRARRAALAEGDSAPPTAQP